MIGSDTPLLLCLESRVQQFLPFKISFFNIFFMKSANISSSNPIMSTMENRCGPLPRLTPLFSFSWIKYLVLTPLESNSYCSWKTCHTNFSLYWECLLLIDNDAYYELGNLIKHFQSFFLNLCMKFVIGSSIYCLNVIKLVVLNSS